MDTANSTQHVRKLNSLITLFACFIDGSKQRSEREVAGEFLRREMQWMRYCSMHHLDVQASVLFNVKASKMLLEWQKQNHRKR